MATGDKLVTLDVLRTVYNILKNPYTTIAANTDLNNITQTGYYSCDSISVAQTLSHCPTTIGFSMIVMEWGAGTAQIINAGSNIYARRLTSESWYNFTGTVVS